MFKLAWTLLNRRRMPRSESLKSDKLPESLTASTTLPVLRDVTSSLKRKPSGDSGLLWVAGKVRAVPLWSLPCKYGGYKRTVSPRWGWLLAIPLLFLFSCATDHKIPEMKSPLSEPEIQHNKKPVQDEKLIMIDEQSGPINNKTNERYIITDPLAEVGRLWYDGFMEEARNRFMDNDVVLLAEGERSAEWSLWRGRLFTNRWSGAELGLAGENVSALLADGDDIWAGTWTGGIIRLSVPLGSNTVWDPGLPSLAVRTVNRITRENDSVWIVRYGSLEHYSLRSGDWSVEEDIPVSERLQDVIVINGKVYLATLGHGLWVKERYKWRMIPNPGLFITRLESGNEGEILIATMDRGLYIYRPEDDAWLRPPPGLLRETNITSLVISGNRIVGGTYGSGAFEWDIKASTVNYFGVEELGDLWVLAVAESAGRYFFGTFGAGLTSLSIATGIWDRIGLAEGFPSADVASLAIDSNGNIWAGTLGGGIIWISGGIYGD